MALYYNHASLMTFLRFRFCVQRCASASRSTTPDTIEVYQTRREDVAHRPVVIVIAAGKEDVEVNLSVAGFQVINS
jgi:hypothetical protein